MKNFIESGESIRGQLNCSVQEREAKHAQRVAAKLGIPVGEPIPQLTTTQMNQYSNVLHHRSGLDHEDARRVFRTVKNKYNNSDDVERAKIAKAVISAIDGLRCPLKRGPKREEVVVYEDE